MSKHKVGDIITFDVTANGSVRPAKLREILSARGFIRWIMLDGYKAKIVRDPFSSPRYSMKSAQKRYDIEFDDGYVIEDILSEHFAVEDEETPVAGIYDEPACTEMPKSCTICYEDEDSPAKIEQDENGFMVCIKCGASYGRQRSVETDKGGDNEEV